MNLTLKGRESDAVLVLSNALGTTRAMWHPQLPDLRSRFRLALYDHPPLDSVPALAADILCFNVESASELDQLAGVAARMGKVAPVSFRVNPDVDPLTHPYISTGLEKSKFGVAFADAPLLYRRAARMPSIACDSPVRSTLISGWLAARSRSSASLGWRSFQNVRDTGSMPYCWLSRNSVCTPAARPPNGCFCSSIIALSPTMTT